MFENKSITQAYYSSFSDVTQSNLDKLLDRLLMLYEA